MSDRIKIRCDAEWIGTALAHEGDNEQAAVLNHFARELRCAIPDRGHHESQVCYIAHLLDQNGVAFVKSLAEFISLREQTACPEVKR